MAQGNIKAFKWNLVLNAKKETPESDIEAELKGSLLNIVNSIPNLFYGAIVHNKDSNENGEHKRTHLHLVLELERKETKTALLEAVSNYGNLAKEQIQLDPTNSEMLAEQYLIHKNDTTKFSYNEEQIITNDRKELERRLALEYLTPAQRDERNRQALLTAHNMTEFFNMVGVEFANKNRGLFKDLLTERKQDIDYLYTRIERLEYTLRNIKNLLEILDAELVIKDKKKLSDSVEFYLNELKDLI